MMNCLTWCAMGANGERAVDILTANQWQKLMTFKKSITVVAKQYEFKLQRFESVGFVTLMMHGHAQRAKATCPWHTGVRSISFFFNKHYPDFQETDWLELNEFVVI